MITKTDLPYIDQLLEKVREELIKATQKHGAISSPHEGYAIIKEELEELWDEIKQDKGSHLHAYEEAIQIAAMAIRYIHDIQKRKTSKQQ